MQAIWIYRLPPVAMALLLIALSSIPGDSLPDYSVFSFDKVLHFFAFGVLAVLTYRAFIRPVAIRRPYLLTCILTIPFAAIDEVHQYFVPGRWMDQYDFIADTLGIMICSAVAAYIFARRPDIADFPLKQNKTHQT